MTTNAHRPDSSDHLGGVKPIKPGQQAPDSEQSKLPLNVSGGAVPQELREAWQDYMVNGFKHNEEMFKRTLAAFMKPYNITIGMYVVLFVIGIAFFVLAAFLSIRDGQSLAAVAFGGLSVASFVLFFLRQPVQALEENLEFITWLGVAFNTYWTRLMYMQDSKTIQSELKAATNDYSDMVERLISKHAELRRKRPGGKLSEVSPVAPPAEPEKPSPQGESQATQPANPPSQSEPHLTAGNATSTGRSHAS